MPESEWSDPEMWARIRAGDEAERARLIEGNYGLVRRISAKQHRRLPDHVDLDEIVGFGTLGLMRAVQNYKPNQPVHFETYAAASIRSLILDELRSMDWAPRSLRRRQRAIDDATTRLQHDLGRTPTTEEIAEALDLTTREVAEVRQATQASHHKSLDEGDPERDWGTREDDNPSSDHLEDQKNTHEAMERLTEEFRSLPHLDRMVLVLKYFAKEPNPKTGELENLKLKAVGERLGITESRASQIHSRAVVKMQETLREALRGQVEVDSD